MSVKIIFIGDPHIKVSNLPEVEIFMERIINLATEQKPDLIVIAGDLLHNHERIHVLALNKAYEMVNNMRLIAKTYILVGNHDMCNNQQFLTSNHWMNGLKEWHNTIIADKVLSETIRGQKFVFIPYVPPGKFVDALDTLDSDWKEASCIFAHQEFFGCKMGAIVSSEGDKWPLDYPNVISGHIHSRQQIQPNIYYSGSALQNAFGESKKNIIACLTFENGKYHNNEVDLKLPRKKILYMDVEEIDTYIPANTQDHVKVTVSGSFSQFKALKRTKKYKDLVKNGIKIIFKPNNVREENITTCQGSFKTILDKLVLDDKNPYLSQAYQLIVNDKDSKVDDVIFL